jgi:hypothetical protein
MGSGKLSDEHKQSYSSYFDRIEIDLWQNGAKEDAHRSPPLTFIHCICHMDIIAAEKLKLKCTTCHVL